MNPKLLVFQDNENRAHFFFLKSKSFFDSAEFQDDDFVAFYPSSTLLNMHSRVSLSANELSPDLVFSDTYTFDFLLWHFPISSPLLLMQSFTCFL